jgi:dephospho-CoA kinase/inosine/xanthosine triphosphate pyrophosphatase family protein
VELLEAHRDAYLEPYGLPKRAFLRAGLEQVIARAGATSILFIEDTTVSIPGLGRGPDFPGQKTKEWFAETSHSELIEEIEKAGGDRRVTVSSDIALHIPGLFPDFPIFSGMTTGHISSAVADVQVNVLYPWLGRSDFSSWFVPDNATKVLAAMELEESMRYDFRVKSLRQLASRLREYLTILNLPQASMRVTTTSSFRNPAQLTMFQKTEADIVLVVVGCIAAGKTTVGHYLSVHRGFCHIEGSKVLARTAEGIGCSVGTSQSMFDLADTVFEVGGPDIIEKETVVQLLEETDIPIVYTGCRTVEGIVSVMYAAHRLGRPFAVVNVSARSSVRLLRARARSREDMPIAPLEFDDISRKDERYGAAALGELICDVHLSNNSDLTSFLNKVDHSLATLRRRGHRWGAKRRALVRKIAHAEGMAGICRVLKRVGVGLVARQDAELVPTSRGKALLALLSEDNR